MRRLSFTLILCGILIAVCGISAQAPEKFKARLAFVPYDAAQRANIGGSGAAVGTLTGRKLMITGTFDGLKSNATTARLHLSPVTGVRGPAVGDLEVSKATSGMIGGSLDLTPVQVEGLRQGRFYVQLHSEKAPDGNLWGWLLK